jgi:dephospho-CoA kinase
MSKKIFGIAGTNGSGKDTVGQMLAERHGWLAVSASGDLIIPELKRRRLPLEREQMAALTAEWNRKRMGAVVDKAIEYSKQQKGNLKGLVLSSLRHPGEADRIHELGGKVVWVDADPRVRYERVGSRMQGNKDKKTYEQFLVEQEREMHHSGDEATLSIADVRKRADIFLENNGNDIEAFKNVAEKALSKYL